MIQCVHLAYHWLGSKHNLKQTTAAGQGFILGITINQEFQRRAQAELDAVVGPNRLPDFEDSDRLAYVNALVREALRWQNVLPFAIPHTVVEDDEFRGYFVPAGTNIIPNVWYA